MTFACKEDQEAFVRQWVREQLGCNTRIRIAFYDGVYAPEFASILPTSDPTGCVPEEERDVAVLEEPEHINWCHKGTPWCDAFNYVVGVVHTNYWQYAITDPHVNFLNRISRALIIYTLNEWVVHAYCHRTIKLSGAVRQHARAVICNVHGVRNKFLDIGEKAAGRRFKSGAYFIGKSLWGKGYTELMDQLSRYRKRTGQAVALDVYGSGPDQPAIAEEAARLQLGWTFYPATDHANLQDYKVMVNPSLSDVVCTTTAEALAMGKVAILFTTLTVR